MDKVLKDAIKEVAEYDGWSTVYMGDNCSPRFEKSGKTSVYGYHALNYHTSADALLDVWRKVRDDTTKLSYGTDYLNKVGEVIEVGNLILDNRLPEAVIRIAPIIKQLKNK